MTGPLGMHIQLKPDVSQKEAALIEKEIGGILMAFIVDNFQDRRTLDRLAKRCNMSITIITTKFAIT